MESGRVMLRNVLWRVGVWCRGFYGEWEGGVEECFMVSGSVVLSVLWRMRVWCRMFYGEWEGGVGVF